MNCQQKSGVFLNISCQNTVAHTCSNCEKKVCEIHAHLYYSEYLCEDCYWETYLFSVKEQHTYIEDNHVNDIDLDYDNTPQSSSSSSGFEEGFGGGGFGGGGALGTWTEGDIQSFNDTSTDNNMGMLGTDDTFFYS